MDLVTTPYELQPSPIHPGERRPVHRLARPAQGRYVGGVCAGLAEHLGLNVRHVRLAFVLAGLAGGAGIAAYLFLWALTPQSLPPAAVAATQTVQERPGNESLRNLVVGLAMLALGGVLYAQQHGVNLRLGLLIPLLTVAGGAVLAPALPAAAPEALGHRTARPFHAAAFCLGGFHGRARRNQGGRLRIAA